MQSCSGIDKLGEPSVTSSDPNERKLARRIRIQRTLEARKKRHDPTEDEAIVEKTATEKQIDASEELLQKLITEGNEIISNVRVANDAREVSRREDEITTRNILLEHLENEAADSLEKYEEINSKWAPILASKDPLDIHAGIQSQTAKCNEVLVQKDVIISELKQELENADLKFENDQKKQSDDINLLIERIEMQITIMSKAYRRELVLIEDALIDERSALLERITKKWDNLYEKRQQNEIDGVERRKQIMREYDKEMEMVLVEHQEQYRSQKIWLETECQKLQQEVQNMQAICTMNIEKLNYSYAVLKRREGENTIVKNQQKKRINKLHDTINSLKKSYMDLEENTKLKIEKLQEQVLKAHKNIQELEAKSRHFSFVNDRQFMQIWEMNTKTADQLLHKILTADQIIYEEMLGLDWEPPEEKLLKKEDLPSYSRAMQIIEQNEADHKEIMKLCAPEKRDISPERKLQEQKLLNHIMRQISDQTGFLIEDKMRDLLSTHVNDDQVVIRLDNVFQALSIESEDQVNLLMIFFLPYAYCPLCDEEERQRQLLEQMPPEEPEDKNICLCNEDLDEKSIRLITQVIKHLPDPNEDVKKPTADSTSSSSELSTGSHFSAELVVPNPQEPALTCTIGHLLQIHSENVIKALREFVEKYHEAKRAETIWGDGKTSQSVTLSRSITAEDMTEYWRRYREIFSRNKEKLWDALMIGLHKYHEILKDRQKLRQETDSLRRQNDELRRLLEPYKVKSETCCIPSTCSRSSNRIS
ncbi:dynein regulatory complex protein 1 [Fopius arisanus]|uniref:Dynein regulatory complex protein 1 n=1 Tax=Fopius arisanus TaxID=64838 RepID=A0A9R1SYB0_9HYME|nr:PREDICTED: dynein regulatory complex protein 1 [Fopius arisanus]